MSKTMFEILASDLAKNYPDESQDAEAYQAKLLKAIELGSRLYRQHDTLFVVHGDEWHSCHGGSGAELLEACNAFLQQLKDEGVKHIFTRYDNPKVSLIGSQLAFKTTIDQINEGKYKTFKLSVEL
jgi:hypothetical protein